jgi:ATP-dependent 26S proteasome regulatory subunit
LNEIDGATENRRVFTMATTNSLQIVASALLRLGRFDRLIEVLSPSSAERVEMFGAVTSEHLSRMRDGFTGAEVRSLFRYSALQALFDEKTEVSLPYFASAWLETTARKTNCIQTYLTQI